LDIGGTFTDVITLGADGRFWTRKILSLLERVADDVEADIWPLAGNDPVECLVHGTTLASDAVIAGTAAPTGFITTRGFRDELEMRPRRPDILGSELGSLPPLVPRSLRMEVDETILGKRSVNLGRSPAGHLLTPRPRVEAVAVSLINSYLKVAHKRQLGSLISEHAPGPVVCLSSDVHPDPLDKPLTLST
jgi:N-methylhydantoinase A